MTKTEWFCHDGCGASVWSEERPGHRCDRCLTPTRWFATGEEDPERCPEDRYDRDAEHHEDRDRQEEEDAHQA